MQFSSLKNLHQSVTAPLSLFHSWDHLHIARPKIVTHQVIPNVPGIPINETTAAATKFAFEGPEESKEGAIEFREEKQQRRARHHGCGGQTTRHQRLDCGKQRGGLLHGGAELGHVNVEQESCAPEIVLHVRVSNGVVVAEERQREVSRQGVRAPENGIHGGQTAIVEGVKEDGVHFRCDRVNFRGNL